MSFFRPNRQVFQNLESLEGSQPEELPSGTEELHELREEVESALTEQQLATLKKEMGDAISQRQLVEWRVAGADGKLEAVDRVGALIDKDATAPFVKPLTIKLKDEESTAKLKEEKAEAGESFSEEDIVYENVSTIPTVKIKVGKNEIPVVPYPYLKALGVEEIPSPEQYFDFLASTVQTPQDIHRLIAPPFGEFQLFGGKVVPRSEDIDPKTGRLYKMDQMEDEFSTIAKGGGECAELSWVAKRMFDILGQRNGHDYKARVIASLTHGVCVYQDKDGSWNGIDQSHHYRNVQNLYSTSQKFNTGEKLSEVELLPKNNRVRVSREIEPSTHEDKFSRMRVKVYQNYPGDDAFDSKDYLPDGWENYDDADILFQDGNVVWFQKGVKQRTQRMDGSTEHYDPNSGNVFYKKYRDGKMEWYSRTKPGHLVQSVYPDGTINRYDTEVRGLLVSTEYPDGTKETYDEKTGENLEWLYRNDSNTQYDVETGDILLTNFYKEGTRERTHTISYHPGSDFLAETKLISRIMLYDSRGKSKSWVKFDEKGNVTDKKGSIPRDMLNLGKRPIPNNEIADRDA
jgi:hypothetical protein